MTYARRELTENGFHISRGNVKLGAIPNFSLLPGATCAEGAPCFRRTEGAECYALKALRMYPQVKTAWGENTSLLKGKGEYDEFVHDLEIYINRTYMKGVEATPLRWFRLHTSGDIFSVRYMDALAELAEKCPDTRFWTYTKQFDVLGRYMEVVGEVPANLNVFLSEWGSYKAPDYLKRMFPTAQVEFRNGPQASGGFRCPGSCKTCKYCGENRGAADMVVFHEH